MRFLKLAVLVLFLGAPLVGCGGDSKPTSPPTVEPAKDKNGNVKPGKPHPPAN